MKKQRPVLFLDIAGVICTRKGAGWTSELMPFFGRLVKTNNYCGLRASDVDFALGLLGFRRDLTDGEAIGGSVESSC